MPISNIVSGASSVPPPGLPGRAVAPEGRQEEFASALPGRGDPPPYARTEEAAGSAPASSLLDSISNVKLQFEVEHGSREVLVKVIDAETEEVLRELPPEELRRLSRGAEEGDGRLISARA